MATITSASVREYWLADSPVGFYIKATPKDWITYSTKLNLTPPVGRLKPGRIYPIRLPSYSCWWLALYDLCRRLLPRGRGLAGRHYPANRGQCTARVYLHMQCLSLIDGLGKLVGSPTVQFNVTVQRDQADAITPWSIRKAISWTLYPDGADPIEMTGAGILEAYGIYGQQPKFIQEDGIPIELLRLFIPPSLTTTISTEQHWIQWVATVCHGKQDPEAAFGTLRSDSTPHWLRYQVWTGAPSFIGEEGHRFNLSAWVDAYRHFRGNSAWLTTVF